MADLPEVLKSMTVKALRDLARKQLGAGYTKLKTKSQLVSALAKGLDGPVAKGLLAKLGGKTAAKAPVKAAAKATAKAKPTPTAKVAKPTATAKPTPTPTRPPTATPTATMTAKPIAKPKAAKPSPVVYDEHLGELPDRYEDDSFIALPVDPSTVFLYWDFNPQTTAAAASGLPSARAVLSVHGDGEKVRELEFALESRSFYLRNLAPGRSYHAEIDFVGSDGRRQRLGRPTNSVGLPPSGPSPIVDDRFIAFPWEWKRGSGAGPFATRPSPGAAQRDLAASGWRGGSSQPMPWFPGGALSGQPVRK